MADIAAIFHWTPRDMGPMSIHELMRWREKASRRSGNEE
jgi:hypothetical protein